MDLIENHRIRERERIEDMQDAYLESISPRCNCCRETIYDDHYDINGDIYCEDCFKENYPRIEFISKCRWCGRTNQTEDIDLINLNGEIVCKECIDREYERRV